MVSHAYARVPSPLYCMGQWSESHQIYVPAAGRLPEGSRKLKTERSLACFLHLLKASGTFPASVCQPDPLPAPLHLAPATFLPQTGLAHDLPQKDDKAVVIHWLAHQGPVRRPGLRFKSGWIYRRIPCQRLTIIELEASKGEANNTSEYYRIPYCARSPQDPQAQADWG